MAISLGELEQAVGTPSGGDRFTVLNRGKTLGTAKKGDIDAGALPDLMAGGQELADLESSLGGTV